MAASRGDRAPDPLGKRALFWVPSVGEAGSNEPGSLCGPAHRQACALFGRAARERQPGHDVGQSPRRAGQRDGVMCAVPADVPHRHAGPPHLPVPARGVAPLQPLRPPHDVPLVPHAGLVQRHTPPELNDWRQCRPSLRLVRASSSPVSRCSSPGWTVGRRRVRAKAISAMRARTPRAARNPLIRLWAFSSTIASAVAGGTSAFCSPALRSASLTKGMPLDSST